MLLDREIRCVETHTAGEPTRIVISSLPELKGETMAEKKNNFEKHFDSVRRLLMHEPRGHTDMFGAILLPPSNPKAELGAIFMDSKGYLGMCVHGSIALVTAAIKTKVIDAREPVTEVVLDTPSGLVRATAHLDASSVKSVAIRNVPSFLYETGELCLPGRGKIPVDIAFGGNFFAIVEAESLGVTVKPESYQQLVTLGVSIRSRVNEKFSVQHPEKDHIQSIDLVEICDRPSHPEADGKNATVFGVGQVDRSPCGTGTSAKMATLYAKGKLGLDEEFVSESIAGTLFKGRLVEKTRVGDLDAVVPEVEGTAYVTGFSQFVLDPSDPLKEGFLLKQTDHAVATS